MSLIGSLLALVLIPLKARPPKREDEANLTFALDHWRNAWHVLWAENERMKAERDHYRDLADEWRRSYAAQERMQQQSFQGLGQLARQVINCVPSRSEVFGNSHGRAT